ncbi:MAG: chitobiase/beta-hexosaminidase C-terminal domain-containing protein, partial [Verrucomicrobiota bacterium]
MISEIMASNQSGLLDDDRERVDWIELHNSNPFEVSLKGWALSDHPAVPDQWVFGEVTMAPRSYLLVFASAKDRPGRRLGDGSHTNFQLSRAGEFLGLYSPEFPRQLVSDLGDQFPEQRMDVSYGRHDTGSLVYFASPSPGSANGGEILTRMLPDPHFSAGRGFYDQTIEVALSSSVEGAQIRYTTDDSEPTATSGMIYSGPLSLSRNTALRAA